MKSDTSPLPSLIVSLVIGVVFKVFLEWSRENEDSANRFSIEDWIRKENGSECVEGHLLWITVAIAIVSECLCYIYFEHRHSKVLEKSPPTRYPYMKFEERCEVVQISDTIEVYHHPNRDYENKKQVDLIHDFFQIQLPPSIIFVKMASSGFTIREPELKKQGEEKDGMVSYQLITRDIQVEWIDFGRSRKVISGYLIYLNGDYLKEQLEVLKVNLDASEAYLNGIRKCEVCWNQLCQPSNTLFELEHRLNYDSDYEDDFLIVKKFE